VKSLHRVFCNYGLAADSLSKWIGIAAGVIIISINPVLRASTIPIPNYSFESPPTDFAYPAIDSWQQVPVFTNQTTGVFSNNPSGPDHLDNCDGIQAAFLFAAPGVGFFQDYNSVDYAHTNPLHDFNVVFETGRSYDLTVGLARSAAFPPNNGATLQAALYYRDSNSNMVIVAATNVVYDTAQFSSTHFLDVTAHLPTVQSTNAWTGKNIGISIMSTVSLALQGGIWDVDNVRLSVTGPTLANPGITGGHFGFTVQSDPGLRFEILASTNITLSSSNWTSIGNVTNVSGSVSFSDPGGILGQRFYQARQLP